MLQLIYMVTSSKNLTKTERIRLALKGEDFGVILSDGILKVNKDLEKPKKLEKLVRKMFEVDYLLSDADDDLFNMLYDEIRSNWGDEVWRQIRSAWSDTLAQKMRIEEKTEASAWLEQYGNIAYTDSVDDMIPDFRSGVIEAIYSTSGNIRDVFNYGFQLGKHYGAKEDKA